MKLPVSFNVWLTRLALKYPPSKYFFVKLLLTLRKKERLLNAEGKPL